MFSNDIFLRVNNSLTNSEIVDWPKMKALTDDPINMTYKIEFCLGKGENIVRKEENAGFQHIIFFP